MVSRNTSSTVLLYNDIIYSNIWYFISHQRNMNKHELLHLPPRNTWTYHIPFPPEAHEPFLISKSKHMNTLVHIALETYEQASSFSTGNTRRNFLTFHQKHMNKLLHLPVRRTNSISYQKRMNKHLYFTPETHWQISFATKTTWADFFMIHQKHMDKQFLPRKNEQSSPFLTRNR